MKTPDTIKAYDQSADTFARDSFKWTPHDLIDEFSNLLKPGSRILDVGCGAGRDTIEFYNRGFETVGLDASRNLLAYAKKRFPEISFIEADMRQIPLPDVSFDGIWCHAVLLHLETIKDVKLTIAEFQRVLKPDGVIHIYTKAFITGPETEVVVNYFYKTGRVFRYYRLELLTKLLSDYGFSIIKANQIEENKRSPKGRPGVYWIHILGKKR